MSVKQFWQDFQELVSEKEKEGTYGYLQLSLASLLLAIGGTVLLWSVSWKACLGVYLFVFGNNINQRINSK